MNNASKISTQRVAVLKANSTAVNELFFSPSKMNKAKALKTLKALNNFVESISIPEPKVTKPKATKPKASLPKGITEKMLTDLAKLLRPELFEEEPKATKPKATKPKAKAKKKTSKKSKARKQSPIEKVADRQDKKFHSSENPILDTVISDYVAERLKAQPKVEEQPKVVTELTIKDGETAEMAYRRTKSERLAKAKESAVKQAMLDFENSL